MTTLTPSTPATIRLTGMPHPGARRFWHAIHNPKSVKTPMLLELREHRHSGDEVRLTFSRLIGQAPTIADAEQIIETAKDILIRAGRADQFAGVIEPEAAELHAVKDDEGAA